MSSDHTAKVCKRHIYVAICFLLELSAVVHGGIFSKNFYNKRFPFWLRDLDILTTAYGDLDITGSFVTTTNLTSPLKAVVVLKRSVLGVNIKIPCIKNFGSCTYNDVCDFGYSQNEDCPPILDELEIPCRCPIEPGIYNIPGVQMKELAKSRWASLLAGKYQAAIKLFHGRKLLACYNINFTLA